MPGNKDIQFANNPRTADGCIHRQRQAFPAALVHNAKNTKPATIGQGIAEKIQAPDLIDAIRSGQRLTRANGTFTALSAFYHEAFLLVDAVYLLQVMNMPFATKHHGKPLVSEAAPLCRDPTYRHAQDIIVAP